MNLGQLLIIAAFLASSAASFFYFGKSKHEIAVRSFQFATGAGVIASVLLLYLLLSHQFQYSYVARYSSNLQPVLYLISAFWAGQEGTFLLWAVLTSILAMIFLRTLKRTDGYAMSAISAYIAFLYLLMIVKSPFETTASVPSDGAGMNPLLQDPWMAIHPPILFIGYAATVFPFALAISGLIRRDYSDWFNVGFGWALFASVTLGAGIIIGGFWAYEVLGWGGYWGWDPVENSSLVPWLVLLALVHGLLVQKATGSLVRTNIFLAIISFLLVLYATFLTRSGVLADFSVHSFVDLGINNYLIAVMVVSTGIGVGLFATRFASIKSPKINFSSFNREVALLLGLVVICAGALFTFVGMSSPILTGLFGKASQVDTAFYNNVNLPIAIGIALLLGITPFLGWSEEKASALFKRLWMPLILTALACVIAYVAGVQSVMLMVFVGSAALSLISNSIIAFRQYKSGWAQLGGPVAHIGVGLLLIGIIGSGNFDDTQHVVLKAGEPQQVHGYQLTFKGIDERAGSKPEVRIEVVDGKTSYVAKPKLYYSEQSQAMMREPDIKVFPLSDLYISPIDLKAVDVSHAENSLYELTKGETKQIGGYEVTFARFNMAQHAEPGAMSVGAVLNVSVDGKNHEVVPQLMFNERGERQTVPANLPLLKNGIIGHQNPSVFLDRISVESKKVYLGVQGVGEMSHVDSVPQLILEVSIKPLMMVVWTGVVLILVGTIIALKQRISIKTS